MVQDAEARLFDNGKSKLFGTFATKADAQQDAMKKASFKRLLLNQCQEEFERNVRSSGGSAALEAAAREARDNAKQAAIDATRAAAEQGVPPKELPDELELEIWITKLKRRMLGNVKFIGELFKQQLLKEKIMHECIKLLLGSLDDPNAVPDDESIEAAAKLFLTIGKQLESPAASKAKLDAHYPESTISNNALATTLHFLGTASGSLFFQEIKRGLLHAHALCYKTSWSAVAMAGENGELKMVRTNWEQKHPQHKEKAKISLVVMRNETLPVSASAKLSHSSSSSNGVGS